MLCRRILFLYALSQGIDVHRLNIPFDSNDLTSDASVCISLHAKCSHIECSHQPKPTGNIPTLLLFILFVHLIIYLLFRCFFFVYFFFTLALVRHSQSSWFLCFSFIFWNGCAGHTTFLNQFHRSGDGNFSVECTVHKISIQNCLYIYWTVFVHIFVLTVVVLVIVYSYERASFRCELYVLTLP